jgi:hydrogenase-4 component B
MIAPLELLAAFLGIIGAGIVVISFLSEQRTPQGIAVIGSCAAIVLMWASGETLFSGVTAQAALWTLPGLGHLSLSMDRLGALFVFITGLVYLPVSIFSAEYLPRLAGRYSLKWFAGWYLALFASLALIPVCSDLVSFLVVWEAMSILSYLLVVTEHEREDNTRAGWLMLVMSEAGTLAMAIALLILAVHSGSLSFAGIRAGLGGLGSGARWAVFLLSFFGLGVKAGLFPFNLWLPRAHPVAPGNVSALLSGVILNLGIYGIVRINLDLLPIRSVGPGLIVLGTGAVTALIGILYATVEDDLKAMLAHSSIENMGIVAAGLGAGVVFLGSAHPTLAAIALVAALYHMLNHSVYKGLLFLGASTVDLTTGTRSMNRLGGLIHRLPWTATAFLVGAMSISALPPFNGFASEWLTLQSILRSVVLASIGVKVVFALAGATLALTAALAVTAFVRAFAMTFLGHTRSESAHNVKKASRSLVVPMVLLALLCLALGVGSTYVIPTLDRTIQTYTHASATEALVPPFFLATKNTPQGLPAGFLSDFAALGAQTGKSILPGRGLVILHRGGSANPVVYATSPAYMFLVLVLLLGLTAGGVWLFAARRRRVTRATEWDGGIRHLTARMTYTASAFAQPVRVIFNAVLRPITAEDRRTVAGGHFRLSIERTREEIHIVDRLISRPAGAAAYWLADRLARMHDGRVNQYALYILVALVVALCIVCIT